MGIWDQEMFFYERNDVYMLMGKANRDGEINKGKPH